MKKLPLSIIICKKCYTKIGKYLSTRFTFKNEAQSANKKGVKAVKKLKKRSGKLEDEMVSTQSIVLELDKSLIPAQSRICCFFNNVRAPEFDGKHYWTNY